MIRKLLSLTIALALLLMPCLALAEDYQSYAAGDGSLSFFYPEGWLLLSRENIDSVLDIASELEGMADLVEPARAQIPPSSPSPRGWPSTARRTPRTRRPARPRGRGA